MKKVIIIGCSGAGKSTFARALQKKTELPLFYLDMLWHKEDKTNITREEFDLKLAEIMAGERWIIDGNYTRTLEMRLLYCDTVFLLDYPLDVCISGVEERIGKPREDMPWTEQCFDPEFREWIENFSRDRLGKIYRLLDKYSYRVNTVVFKTREEAERYINNL